MDHRDHGEEHHQQRGERQSVLKGAADLVLIGDAGKRGDQHDHQQADQPHFGDVEGQAEDQHQCCQALHQQRRTLGLGAMGIVLTGVLGQHLTHGSREQGAVTEPAQLLQQHAGGQAGDQYR